MGNPTIDYFSLDIEGAELPVLKVGVVDTKTVGGRQLSILFLQTIPFDKVDIRVLQIEMDHVGEIFPGTKRDIKVFLASKGFKFVKVIGVDHIYVRRI